MKPLFLILALTALATLESTAKDDPTWPEKLSVECGDLAVSFEGPRQRWTMESITYRNVPVALASGAYGTVFNFPDIGFIGTGHHENETEPIDSLEFFLDGERLESVSDSLRGTSFRLKRRSHIKSFLLEGEVALRDNRLWETATVKLPADAEPVALKLNYHFMHPWHVDSTHYLAGRGDEITVSGEFHRSEEANRKFYVNAEVDWIAIYNAGTKTFLVSYLLEKPDQGGAVSMIWNVHGAYRKFYLKCFNNQEVPPGFEGTYRMVTGFGQAKAAEWQNAARQLAAEFFAAE